MIDQVYQFCGLAAGVALDDLVYLCTKLARQMDNQGVDKVGGQHCRGLLHCNGDLSLLVPCPLFPDLAHLP